MWPLPGTLGWNGFQSIGSPMPSSPEMFSSNEWPSTVVLVEDDEAVRESLRFSLESDGFAVMICETGEALVAAQLPDSPTCLLLDQNLGPGLTGLDALKVLRAQGVSSPAITMTTLASAALKRQAHDLGAEMIEKPLVGETLFRAIEAAFATIGPNRLANPSSTAGRAL
jgi:FixJ family two-component response regulator